MSEISDIAGEAHDRIAGALIRVGRGDPAALHYLFVHTRTKLFSICLRICGDVSAAEDVLHDVYLIVWHRAEAWERGRGSPIAWLARITRNRAIDWRRTKGRQALPMGDALPEIADPALSAEATLIATGEARRLADHFSHLSPPSQDAIRAAFFDDVSYREIAAAEGVPIGTVKSRIHNGLAKLKRRLEQEDVASSIMLRAD